MLTICKLRYTISLTFESIPLSFVEIEFHFPDKMTFETMRLEPPRAIRRNLSATSNGNSSRKQDECIQSKRWTSSSSMPTEPSPKESCSPYKVAEKISIIQTMMVQESSTYMASHYLHRAAVTAEERAWLCQWGFDILDACEINRTIAVIAIGYFDRYLSNRGLECVEVCLSNQRDFQLAFIVSDM